MLFDIFNITQPAMPSAAGIAGRVPSTQMALQRWMVMEMRWNRNDVSLLSPELADKRLPSLDRNWNPLTQIGPKVSKARGQNKYRCVKSVYFVSFFEAASSAAPLIVDEVEWMYEAASVSATVTSHMSDFPCDQGISVIPSGLFPSDRANPDGSLHAGICAEFNDTIIILRNLLLFLLFYYIFH